MNKNLQPTSFLFTYKNSEGEEFTTTSPIAAIPVRVTNLFTGDQLHKAQEAIKTECALILKGVINGDIYAERIKAIEVFK